MDARAKRTMKKESEMHGGAQRVLLSAVAGLAVLAVVSVAPGADILLDGDTPATGSNLGTQPLVTPYGTITFDGDLRDRDNDIEFNAAGALGNVFDIHDRLVSTAQLVFDFDIISATFIYGGNVGVIDLEARNGVGGVVDSFYQANTETGQPAGPVTVAGQGIRELYWEDPGYSFCALDNIEIIVPEPATLSLLALGGLALIRRKRQ